MALGNVVARLLVRLGIDKREFDSGARDADRAAKGLRDSLQGTTGAADVLTGALKVAGVAGLGALATKAVDLAVDLGRTGAEALRLSSSFEDLAQQAGGSADALLAAMKEATAGTVAEMDLVLAANKGMLLGLGADTEQWSDLLEVARYRSRAMGITMTQAVDDITTAIGRESKMIADNLGIIWDMDAVMGNYAATLGKAADELTGAERKQALLAETIRIGQGQIEAAGGINDDYADSFARMEAAIEDAKTALSEVFAPAIADVAGAVADIIPDLVEAVQYLSVLANAGIEWAQAAFEGKDAAAAFNAEAMRLVGTAEDAARAQLAVADAELEAARAQREQADAWVLAELAAKDFSAIGYDLARQAQQEALARERAAVVAHSAAEAALGLASAEREAGEAAAVAAATTEELTQGVLRMPGAFQAAESAMMGLAAELQAFAGRAAAIQGVLEDLAGVSLEEVGTQFSAVAGRIETGLAGLAGEAPLEMLRGLRNQYISELTKLYTGAGDLTELELAYRQQLIMNAFDDEVATLRQAAADEDDVLGDMASRYRSYADELRGIVASALQPTSVTALDMQQTALGLYVDKWDEDARRLDAIAQGGFEELAIHPDWAAMLQIPPEILASGEDVLKEWARQTSSDVRNLFRPDLLADNLDAMVLAVEQYMEQQAAREYTIDMVVKAMVAEGYTAADAQAAVEEMMGLDQAEVTAMVGLDEKQLASLSMQLDEALGLGTPREIPVTMATMPEEAAALFDAPAVDVGFDEAGLAGLSAALDEALGLGTPREIPVTMATTVDEALTLTASVGLDEAELEGLSAALDEALGLGTPRAISISLGGAAEGMEDLAGSPLVDLLVGGDADMESAGGDLARQLLRGYDAALADSSPIAQFARRVQLDVEEQYALLQSAGKSTWKPIWEAIREAIYVSPFVNEIASAVSPYVAKILAEQGAF